MLAAFVDPRSPERPRVRETADPVPAAGEVVLAIAATALNHADLLQLRGLYPPPPGESEVLGLECSGTVEALGEGVTDFAVGDRVMALLAGGGHATRVAVPVGQLMPIPEELSFTAAAALPEACLTAWTNLVAEGGLGAGETVLVTGATGGMGSMAVQVAHLLGARVVAAGRHRERLEPLRRLGAEALVTLDDDLPAQARAATGGRGIDLAFDLVGGEHLPRVLASLADRGRLVLVGLLAGRRATVDLGDVLRRRLRLVGSVLRARSRQEKAQLVAGFHAFAAAPLASGTLRPQVDRILPFSRLDDAYGALRRGGVQGKVVVEVTPP